MEILVTVINFGVDVTLRAVQTSRFLRTCRPIYVVGAGCSSVNSVSAFEAVGRRIDPSQWTQLQFGLFSVLTSGPQLVYQRPWYVLFCLWKSAYKRSLAAYRKE